VNSASRRPRCSPKQPPLSRASNPTPKKLIGRSGTALCNECVSLACDIMDAELGDNWR
jgi:ATP-dependent protease Clp ATPase subunit